VGRRIPIGNKPGCDVCRRLSSRGR
jgi:hypothetical protein